MQLAKKNNINTMKSIIFILLIIASFGMMVASCHYLSAFMLLGALLMAFTSALLYYNELNQANQ